MTDKRIDFARAVELFQLAVEERGEEYVYERPPAVDGCYYTDQAFDSPYSFTEYHIPLLRPGCAWGLALSKAGLISLADLALESGFVVDVMEKWGFVLTPKAKLYMTETQSQQDAGATWGEAHKGGVLRAESVRWDNEDSHEH